METKTWQDFRIEVPFGATGHIRTICPECSKDRRKATEKCLSVDVGEGLFLCHHCSFKGGLGNNKKDTEIVKYFTLPKQEIKTNLPGHIVDWFKNRGITEKTLIKFKIGFGDKKDVQFPYFKNGKIVNIKHRSLPKTFWQEKDAEKCLYNFDEISKTWSKMLIITEGEIDSLSFSEAGFIDVTSVPDGAPSESAKEFHTKFNFLKSAETIIGKFDKIILAMDNDTPGKLMEAELARRIGVEKCYRVEYPVGCKDSNETLTKYGSEKLNIIIKNAKPFPVEGLFSASEFKNEVENLYALGVNRGLSTGWALMDTFYTVKVGEVTIITGIPGMGKSTWMDNISVNMMQNHDWKFLFFSPENWPVERHIQNLLEKILKQPFAKRTEYADRMGIEDALETLDIIGNYMFFVYPKEGYLKVDEILEKAKIAIFRHGVNGIVIDPWNEVDHDYDSMTEAQYLSKSLSKIRMFAKRNGIHIWVIAHPKNLTKDKDGNYNPPTMYEISGGAHWRNKADNGICIHRQDYNIDETDVIIQKIRFKEVGKTGSVKLKFSREIGVYYQ